MSGMRRILAIVGIALAAVVAGLAALYLFVDVNRFRDQIAGELQKQLHRPVSLGKMSLGLFPLAVRVDDLAVEKLARARSVSIKAGLRPLLQGNIAVNSLVLLEPIVEVFRTPSGEWNFADLIAPKSGDSKPFTLDLLKIENGTLSVNGSKYEHLNVEAADIGPGRKTTLKTTVTLAEPNGVLSASGTVSPEGGKTLVAAKFDVAKGRVPMAGEVNLTSDPAAGRVEASRLAVMAGKLSLSGSGTYDTKASTIAGQLDLPPSSLAELLALAQVFGGPAASGTGTVALHVAVNGPVGEPTFSGEGSLRDASLQPGTITKPLAVRTASIQFDGRTANISNLDATLGSTNIKGSVGYSGSAIRFDLDADRIDVAEWQQLPAAPKPGKAGTSAGGTGPAPSVQGNLHIGTLQSQGIQLTEVRARTEFRNGQLTLSPLSAKLFGGSQTGKLVADLRPKVPTVSLDLELDNVETNQLLTATSSIRNLLYGALSASGGMSMQLGAGDLPRTLNGTLSANVLNGKLLGTNILKELAGVGKVTESLTNIAHLGGDIEFRNGLATTNNLQMAMEGGSLAATGSVNLVDQTLNLKATAILDRALSQKAGGALSIALANNKGELTIPVNITGTLAKPRFVPDTARYAEMKLKTLQSPQGIIDLFRRKK